MLQALHRWIKSMGLTFVLGFLLCIFQSSESILVKLSNNRPDPHPSSAKLLLLSEFLKLLISYTLLSVERKQLVGLASVFRRRCCRSGKTCCRSGKNPDPLQDDEEQQMHRGKRLLDNQDNDDDEDYEDDVVSPTTPSSTTSSSCNIPPILFFAVPGAIYFFNNNLSFILLELMPAPTYVVLSNLKILTTGLFSYLFLHRLLTKIQWISLGVLFFSTAVSQVDLEKGLSLSISIQAFLLMVLFCSLSAAASVFSEYVMKERFAKESIHLQNMKLYMFGILFNGITYMLTPPAMPYGAPPVAPGPGAPPPPPAGFFSDMTFLHFTIVLAYASLGLVTSAIIKFSGSITKVYASSMSMFFAALVSWLFLSDQLTVLFFVGCFGCCYALHLYYRVAPSSSVEPATATATAEDDSSDKAMEDVRRDSASSSTSSTTLAVSSSPDSTKDPKAAGSQPMTSVRVVDRHEYLSLDTLDHDEQTEDRRSSSDRR
ncbi:hypothetical protein KI688_006290 [Linnemannia hyalina]|uniref:Nucleotide-sugar transporter n=1 Tax=Linnemannia hyalina TaxID=64524 RepID=A0A9P8BY57_9FUNG|nr:hypothetical protein KI688_006290 [Linnemannia hyalina]